MRYITVADLTAMLVGVLEFNNNDDVELDLIDQYAYPIANGNLVLNQGIRLGPTPFVGITNYIQYTVWRCSNDLPIMSKILFGDARTIYSNNTIELVEMLMRNGKSRSLMINMYYL